MSLKKSPHQLIDRTSHERRSVDRSRSFAIRCAVAFIMGLAIGVAVVSSFDVRAMGGRDAKLEKLYAPSIGIEVLGNPEPEYFTAEKRFDNLEECNRYSMRMLREAVMATTKPTVSMAVAFCIEVEVHEVRADAGNDKADD